MLNLPHLKDTSVTSGELLASGNYAYAFHKATDPETRASARIMCGSIKTGLAELSAFKNLSKTSLLTQAYGYWCLTETTRALKILTGMQGKIPQKLANFIEKGAEVSGVGFALTLVFGGGAAGKLVCGFIAERYGILKTMILTEVATGLGLIAVTFLPLNLVMILLPFLGLALNGTSSVLYGSVGDFVDERSHARAFGLFYTLAIGVGAVSPLLYGLISDRWGLQVCLNIMAGSLILLVPLFFPLSSRLVKP